LWGNIWTVGERGCRPTPTQDEDGNYTIDPDKIAGKLLRMEQELAAGRRSPK
jgi:hypothetical protein